MNLAEFAAFQELKREMAELKARVEALEQKRSPGRPKTDKEAA